jgi:hypothetical protein
MPKVIVDDSQLGSGAIADLLREQWMDTEPFISELIEKLILSNQQMPGQPISPASIEKLGAHCGVPDANICKYEGNLTYRVENARHPDDDRNHGRVQIGVVIDLTRAPIAVTTTVTNSH